MVLLLVVLVVVRLWRWWWVVGVGRWVMDGCGWAVGEGWVRWIRISAVRWSRDGGWIVARVAR